MSVQLPATTLNFRNMATNPPPMGLAPTFLLGPNGSRFMYCQAIIFDAIADGAGYAVLAGLPTRAPSDAYQYIASDRQIFQGYQEAPASFIARAQQWLDYWRHAGSNEGVMLAELGLVTPDTPEILCVQSSSAGTLSKWETYAAAADPFPAGQTNPTPPYVLVVRTANWQWDGAGPPFYYPWMSWRTWVVVFSLSGSPWAAPSATYDSTIHYDDGTCWGWAGTHQQALSLTGLARQWKTAGVWIPWVMVTYDGTMFDSSQAFGSSKLPDGHWGYWSKIVSDATYGQVRKPARADESIVSYLDGSTSGLEYSV